MNLITLAAHLNDLCVHKMKSIMPEASESVKATRAKNALILGKTKRMIKKTPEELEIEKLFNNKRVLDVSNGINDKLKAFFLAKRSGNETPEE